MRIRLLHGSPVLVVALAAGILVYSLMTGDFRFAYVAEHSNRSMPMLYKFAAWWGGQEGSLLLWSWLLATYTMVVVFTNRRKHRDMMPYVLGVLGVVQTFFLILNNFIANPFRMLAVDGLITPMKDGNGLSPLLQYPAMAIHPPMLYGMSYVDYNITPATNPEYWHRIWCVTKQRKSVSAPHDTPRGIAFMPILDVSHFKRSKSLAAGVTYVKV